MGICSRKERCKSGRPDCGPLHGDSCPCAQSLHAPLTFQEQDEQQAKVEEQIQRVELAKQRGEDAKVSDRPVEHESI